MSPVWGTDWPWAAADFVADGARSRLQSTTSDPTGPDGDLSENGGLLPGLGATLAGPTFEEWLDSRAGLS